MHHAIVSTVYGQPHAVSTYLWGWVCVQPWLNCRLHWTSWSECIAALLCNTSPKLTALYCCIYVVGMWNEATQSQTLCVLNSCVIFLFYARRYQFDFWLQLSPPSPTSQTTQQLNESSPSLALPILVTFLNRFNDSVYQDFLHVVCPAVVDLLDSCVIWLFL